MVMVLIGASHHDLSLPEIDEMAKHEEQIRTALFRSQVPSEDLIAGGVILSTCNRFEMYLDVARFHDAVDHALGVLSKITGFDPDYCANSMRVSVGNAVVQHLFAVNSGLASMVVGEDEIAGQVRNAFKTAQSEGVATPAIQRLFQRSAAVSKEVTNATGLGDAGRSLVNVALDLVERKFGPLQDKRALVLGTGAYARVVVAALKRRNCAGISVYSSSNRAELFSSTHDTTPVLPGHLPEALREADVVIACSGGGKHLIDPSLILQARSESSALLPIIDLAISADVSPETKNLNNVDVIDLETIRNAVPPEHSQSIRAAQDIVMSAAIRFDEEEGARTADGAVVAIRSHVRELIEMETARVRARSGNEVAAEVERALNRVTNALLHRPSVQLHALAQNGSHADYEKALRLLFGIEIEPSGNV